MADRSMIFIQCPGDRDSATVLAVYPASVAGVGHPRNGGECPLSIAGEDRHGRVLHPNLVLRPGESREWFYPPAGAQQIIVAGFANCTGMAVLEYDTPEV